MDNAFPEVYSMFMGSIDTARRLLYGAAAGAAVLIAGENTEAEDPKPNAPEVQRQTDEEGERYRALFQRLFEQEHPEYAAKEAARQRQTEQIVSRMPTMEVKGLIEYLDHDLFAVRQAATKQLLSLGLAVGEINPDDREYSPEQRQRLRMVERNIQIIHDSVRWNGSLFRMPEGWREGEERSFSEIIRQLRRSGETGISTEHAQASILESSCRVPKDGTPFWQVYEALRGDPSDGRCSVNVVSAGTITVGNPCGSREFTASDGALLGEMKRMSPTRVGVYFHTEGTMQMAYWQCRGARAVYPDGTHVELTPAETEGNWSDTLYLDLPEPPEGNIPDIEIRLSCEAWPMRTKEVTDFALEEHQETPDKGLRFLEVRENEIAETGKPPRKEYFVYTMDYHNIEFDTSQPYCPMSFSGIEAFNAQGDALDGGYALTHSEMRHTRKAFAERPARVLLRSIDFDGRAVAEKTLRYRGVDLRDRTPE